MRIAVVDDMLLLYMEHVPKSFLAETHLVEVRGEGCSLGKLCPSIKEAAMALMPVLCFDVQLCGGDPARSVKVSLCFEH